MTLDTPRFRRPPLAALLLMGLWFLAGCTVHKVEPVGIPPETPPAFSRTGEAVQPRWWKAFDDSDLTRLVERALRENPGLLQAWARLDQSRALADQAAAGFWPDVTAEGQAGRSRSNVETGNGTTAVRSNRFSLTGAASYEVDLWGRIASGARAAGLDAEAARSDAETAAMTLAAEVADVWFQAVEQQARLDLARDQLETNRTLLELIQTRFGYGLSSALDVYQQKQLVSASQAEIPPIRSNLQVLRHRLAVLLGRPPGESVVDVGNRLPEPPPLPDIGVPADLVRRRPDIRAAGFRLAAADHRVARAVADRFPAFRLSAGGGYRAGQLADLFSTSVWDLLGGVSAPLLDGGQRRAEVRRVKAVVRERTADYLETALAAFREVEDALVRESFQREFMDRLEEQIANARQELEQARLQYENGIRDYLNVLIALRNVQSLERQWVGARRLLLTRRIELYRALGGAWTGTLTPPEAREKS
jgi:NodT family efflux transporter outer membrane factor (OMF) lipoprotein